ncbi:hypothetical protein [Actinoplanes sp. NPDC020271]|uniref:hypothetical protein n=1 Tax=Actinoplanes sp. NPDC020271 TaxID=3363896 RepID=UPI003792CE00
MRISRAALGSVLLAGLFISVPTAAYAADPVVVTVPASAGHPMSDVSSIEEVIVDATRRRVLVTDPQAGRLLSVSYDGTTAAEVTGLTDVHGVVLSADSSIVYVAVTGADKIVALNAADLSEVTTYPTQGASPRGLALAGGRLWFTSRSYGFGVLDPATGAVRTHTSPTGNLWYGSDPMIAKSPVDPDVIAVGGYYGPVALYDVSGDVEQEIALRSLSTDVHSFNDMSFSADGSRISLGGDNGILHLSTADLTTVGTTALNESTGLARASNGWLATIRPYMGYGDLLLLPAGSTEVTREVRLPNSSIDGGVADLAWEPGGSRLIAITSHPISGAETLWVVEQPTVTSTAVQVTAPATATRGTALTVTGKVTGIPAGTGLTVTRTDVASPTGVALPAVTVTDAGTFALTDAPPVGGTVTYTVSYPGADGISAASGNAAVAVSRTTPVLTLTPNKTVNGYGATVTLTAHLGATYTNRTVQIWADPNGTDQANRLLKTATVNSVGNVSVALKLTRSTVIRAVFNGDDQYEPRTVTNALYTKVNVSTAMAKAYKTGKIGSTSYYFVRKSVNPIFTTTMTYSAGRKQKLSVEYYSGGKWKTFKSALLPLNKAGKSVYTLTGSHKTGVRYRVRAAYLPGTSRDSFNYTTYGSWKYFTFK